MLFQIPVMFIEFSAAMTLISLASSKTSFAYNQSYEIWQNVFDMLNTMMKYFYIVNGEEKSFIQYIKVT